MQIEVCTYRGKKKVGASPHQSNRNRIIPHPHPNPSFLREVERQLEIECKWHAAYCTKVLSSKQSLQRSPIGSNLALNQLQRELTGKRVSLFSDAFCRRASLQRDLNPPGKLHHARPSRVDGFVKEDTPNFSFALECDKNSRGQEDDRRLKSTALGWCPFVSKETQP